MGPSQNQGSKLVSLLVFPYTICHGPKFPGIGLLVLQPLIAHGEGGAGQKHTHLVCFKKVGLKWMFSNMVCKAMESRKMGANFISPMIALGVQDLSS